MSEENNIEFKFALIGNRLEVEEAIEVLNSLNIKTNVISSVPLHMGIEEINLALCIVGGVSSILTVFEFLRKNKTKFEIQIKAKDDQTIFLRKNSPWTLQDIKRILKLEEE